MRWPHRAKQPFTELPPRHRSKIEKACQDPQLHIKHLWVAWWSKRLKWRRHQPLGYLVDHIIIGTAFGKIVSSFVEDVIMPPIGFLVGAVDFADLAITLQSATGEVPAVTLTGKFIQTVFDFPIVAFAIFIAIKAMNALKKQNEAPPEPLPPSKEELLLTEIRDLI